ncbi:MAG TPA: hypothetical protein VFW96_09300 [Thermomicrobiales bacterium]|nr:hypothetical protein [Thermomicrobiales bacterium]
MPAKATTIPAAQAPACAGIHHHAPRTARRRTSAWATLSRAPAAAPIAAAPRSSVAGVSGRAIASPAVLPMAIPAPHASTAPATVAGTQARHAIAGRPSRRASHWASPTAVPSTAPTASTPVAASAQPAGPGVAATRAAASAAMTAARPKPTPSPAIFASTQRRQTRRPATAGGAGAST